MATLTIQTPILSGITPSYAAAAGGGDEFPNDGRTMLHVKNGGGGSITVTVNSLVNCDQGVDHDSVTSVGAGAEAMIGAFNITRFNNSATGRAAITYSGVTSVTIGAFKVVE